jgi:hypothetical protein
MIFTKAEKVGVNSRNLNGDLDAKLVSCIPGLKDISNFRYSNQKIINLPLKFTQKTYKVEYQFINHDPEDINSFI